jgi:hypothetical protein
MATYPRRVLDCGGLIGRSCPRRLRPAVMQLPRDHGCEPWTDRKPDSQTEPAIGRAPADLALLGTREIGQCMRDAMPERLLRNVLSNFKDQRAIALNDEHVGIGLFAPANDRRLAVKIGCIFLIRGLYRINSDSGPDLWFFRQVSRLPPFQGLDQRTDTGCLGGGEEDGLAKPQEGDAHAVGEGIERCPDVRIVDWLEGHLFLHHQPKSVGPWFNRSIGRRLLRAAE